MHYLEYKISHHTKPWYVNFCKINRCIKDYDRNKYLTLIFSEEKDKDVLKKYETCLRKLDIF